MLEENGEISERLLIVSEMPKEVSALLSLQANKIPSIKYNLSNIDKSI